MAVRPSVRDSSDGAHRQIWCCYDRCGWFGGLEEVDTFDTSIIEGGEFGIEGWLDFASGLTAGATSFIVWFRLLMGLSGEEDCA